MPETSGYTLMHEHITLDLSGVKKDLDCRLDCFDETVAEFQSLYASGVRTIIDVTNKGMGRNPAYVKKVSALTGITILQATGYYKEPFLPDEVYSLSADGLAAFMLKELQEGIGSSGIKAALIGEIGTGPDGMTPAEKKVFDGAIIAAKKTNCPIYTHTTLGSYALEQARYLLAGGVHPDKIIIGHMDLSQETDDIMSVLDTGVTIGFDTIGKNNYCPDEKRAEMLLALQNSNRMNKVVLSLDITRKSNMKYNNGIGYNYLFETFLPLLRKTGITEKSIQQMLKINPMKIFAPEQESL